MFLKIAVSIVWIGVSAIGLLMIRQQRIDAVHDQAAIHARLLKKRQMLWQLRIETHEMLTPQRVTELIGHYCEENGVTFKPLLLDPCLQPVGSEAVVQSVQSTPSPSPSRSPSAGSSRQEGVG